jgi:hypothetical protein
MKNHDIYGIYSIHNANSLASLASCWPITGECFTVSDRGFRRNSRGSDRKICLLSDDTSKIPRYRRIAEAFTTPAYLVIGWPFIVDYWQKKAFALPRNTGTLPVRSTSLPRLRGCALGRTPARRFTILLLRSRSIPELGARNNRATS